MSTTNQRPEKASAALQAYTAFSVKSLLLRILKITLLIMLALILLYTFLYVCGDVTPQGLHALT